jgi:pyrimidine operon attenuation protein/uracil phosphoribosyltransferase
MFYKQRPYIYAGIGAFGLYFGRQFNSKLAVLSGLVLVACGLIIFFMRKDHQAEKEKLSVKHTQLSKEIQKKK